MSAFAKRQRGSLRSFFGSGKTGGKGIRTPDLLIANETLYQLSYTPKRRGNYRGETIFRQAIPKIVSNPICYYLSVERDELAKFAAFEFCGRSGVIDDKLSAVDWS